jgi:hypothetical protein
MKWSFSGLKDFETCPRQYYEVRVAKNYVKGDTPQTLYGKEVHKACEDYVRDDTPLVTNYLRFKPTLDALKEIPGDKYLEHEMALTVDKLPCKFDAPEYWVRGIADYLCVDNDVAYIADYKTGKVRPDLKQLKLMALMTFAHFPQVNHINGILLFVMHDAAVDESYKREDIPKLWAQFEFTLQRLNLSYNTGNWFPKPSGLCKRYCPVETCNFYGG